MRSTGMWIVGVVLVVLLSGCLAAAGPGPSAPSARPFNVAVYGDSFTVAWEPDRGDQPGKSWATGTDANTNSILQRVQVTRPDAVGINAAVSGARIRDVPHQTTSAGTNADLVLIWLGLNDLCRNSAPEDLAYGDEVGAAFDLIRATHPRAKVVAFSIPDMWRLHEEHLKDPAAVAFWKKSTDYCPDFFHPPAHALAATFAQTRLKTLNTVIRTEAVTRGFTYSDALTWPPLTLGHLSDDYFHPNPAGESAIAAAAWPAVSRVL